MNKLNNKLITISNTTMKRYLNNTNRITNNETKFLLDCKVNYCKNNLIQKINPLAWEVGHIANFYDIYLLKYIKKNQNIIKNKIIFNSHLTPLDQRFIINEHYISQLLNHYNENHLYLDNWLDKNKLNNKTSYLYLLSILHNHMHIESILYSKRSLFLDKSYNSYEKSFNTDIHFIKIDEGEFYQGTKEGEYLISFDNEKPLFKTY